MTDDNVRPFKRPKRADEITDIIGFLEHYVETLKGLKEDNLPVNLLLLENYGDGGALNLWTCGPDLSTYAVIGILEMTKTSIALNVED